jgi:polysaccharide export outer membrane protein
MMETKVTKMKGIRGVSAWAAWPVVASVILVLTASPLSAQDPDPPTGEAEPLELSAFPVEDTLPTPVSSLLDDSRTDYRIGRQDLLEIEVFDVDELSQTVRVGQDGSISMPLLGRLVVAGLTKAELEQLIARLLEGRYVRDPQVTVFVREYESKKIAVTGAVKRPGTFEMLGRKTLLEVISMAGGLDTDLGKHIIVFRRQEDESTKRIAVDLERLVYQADPQLNLLLEPNDIVYIPAVEKIRIFVSGAVRNPDVYEVPRDEPVTVLKAVTIAGGTTVRASIKKVQVLRTDENGERVVLYVDLQKVKRGKAEDPLLHEGDIVLVPESFF